MSCHTVCYLVLSRPRPTIPRSISALIGMGHSRTPAADLFCFNTYSEDPTSPDHELRQYLDALPPAAFRLVVTGDRQVQLGGYDHHPFVDVLNVPALDRDLKSTRYTFNFNDANRQTMGAVSA